jgi:glycosyltransferase involved in cell wall biosynthesis
MRFAIFTHVEHLEREGRYYAYAPYVREMNVWLRHVEVVEVVAPRTPAGQLVGLESYKQKNLTFTRIPSFHFLNIRGAVKAIIKIPYIFFKIYSAMQRADHLHLRCPGNIGLLACICQVFFPSKPKSAKYAGNWDPAATQPRSYRFQKWLLSNTFFTRNMQVLVYGEWPEQSKNVIPFFTASFSEHEKNEVSKKAFFAPFIFLFVGNLVKGKQPLEAIKLVERINAAGKTGKDQEIHANQSFLNIYGDGPEWENLEEYCKENNLEDLVHFKGSRSLEDLKSAYQKAHFVILLSRSEGWPKAIAEAMFFGCIPIATPVSCVPWMLGGDSRGILITDKNYGGSRVESENHEGENEWSVVSAQCSENVQKIKQLIKNPEEIQRMSDAAKQWSQQYTLEKFEIAIKEVLQGSKKSSSPFGRGGGVG